jgi:ferredoxin-NADP reductase
MVGTTHCEEERMPATPTYDVEFLERSDAVAGTGTFRFSKPAGYDFAPGQFMSLTLNTRDGEQTKPFTHDESPADPYLEITTRLTGSAFKDALLALEPGYVVRVAGPRGRMTLPDGVRKVAFLVGGVGVTPARSIIRDALARGTGLRTALFYGNQDEASIPFRVEFDGYAAAHPEILVVHVLAVPGATWAGERGFITADTVRRHIDPLDGWHWVVTGPPAMISAMARVLTDLAVPEDRVSTESFAGYE